MDRSFLSRSNVVQASRSFVCIRVATYEDQSEADFMKSVYVPHTGEIANTTFALLSSDGKRNLVTPGRGPFTAYRTSSSMGSGMRRIAALHPGSSDAIWTDPNLPFAKDMDLALNIASCDLLPVIAIVANEESVSDRLQQQLRPIIWSESLAGQFVLTLEGTEASNSTLVRGLDNDGIYVIEPGPFGMSGTVLTYVAPSASAETMTDELTRAAIEMPRLAKDHDGHVRMGIQLGIKWESKIPETDWEAVRAEQRARGR